MFVVDLYGISLKNRQICNEVSPNTGCVCSGPQKSYVVQHLQRRKVSKSI